MARTKIQFSHPPKPDEIEAAQATLTILVANEDVAEVVRQAGRFINLAEILEDDGYDREAASIVQLGDLALTSLRDIDITA